MRHVAFTWERNSVFSLLIKDLAQTKKQQHQTNTWLKSYPHQLNSLTHNTIRGVKKYGNDRDVQNETMRLCFYNSLGQFDVFSLSFNIFREASQRKSHLDYNKSTCRVMYLFRKIDKRKNNLIVLSGGFQINPIKNDNPSNLTVRLRYNKYNCLL